MKMKRIRVLVILVLFLMLFMMTGCNSKNDLVDGGGRDVPSGFYSEGAIAGSIEGDDSIVDGDTDKDDTSDIVIKPGETITYSIKVNYNGEIANLAINNYTT